MWTKQLEGNTGPVRIGSVQEDKAKLVLTFSGPTSLKDSNEALKIVKERKFIVIVEGDSKSGMKRAKKVGTVGSEVAINIKGSIGL